jgi:hypothetical protein
LFFQDFIKTDGETRAAVEEAVQTVSSIRQYEESLFLNRN